MKYLSIIFFCLSICFSQTLSAQCVAESHSPFADQGWLSCQKTLSVIPERGEQHWILYDFGKDYRLLELSVWNHNVWGQTGAGVKSILIDYSLDQETWLTIGPIEIRKAPGSWKYTIDDSINLGEIEARYVLMTAIETWDSNSSCAGFSEIRIDVDQIIATDDQIEKTKFDLYPNPANNVINLNFEDISQIESIELSNAVGQVLRSYVGNSTNQIDVSDLTKGMYVVSMYTDSGKISQTFVKM